MQRDVLPSPDAYPELQAFQTIEATHPLPIHQPPSSASVVFGPRFPPARGRIVIPAAYTLARGTHSAARVSASG